MQELFNDIARTCFNITNRFKKYGGSSNVPGHNSELASSDYDDDSD
jgi:hypothetical protein